MKIIDRYIGGTIAMTTLLVMLVLLAFFSFAALINELDNIGKGNYGLLIAFQYVLLSLPKLAYQLFPMVALLGAVIGLGILANNNELVVMRAAGVSIWRLVGAVMKAGVVLMIASLIIGEYLAPPSEKYAQELRRAALEKRYVMTKTQGLWAREGRNFVHIRDVLAQKELGGVSIYEFDEGHQLRTLITAQYARYQDDNWMLHNVTLYQISVAGMVTQHLERQPRLALVNPEIMNVVAIKPDIMPFAGLYNYVSYLKENGLNALRYEQALWGKLVMPLTTGVMVFLAIPFVFGPLRSVGIGQRIMVGTLVGIGFHLFSQTFNHIGVLYGLNSAFSVIFPTTIFFILGLWLTRRVR